MKEFATNKGILVAVEDIVRTEPTNGSATIVWLTPESIVTDSVRESCGCCEECYANGMPQYCQSEMTVLAYFYRVREPENRIYGSPELGFYLK